MKSTTRRGQNGRSRVYEANTIRVVELDGEPWFVAVDVCKTLGFALNKKGIPNTSQACRPLNADERGVYLINTPQPKCPEYSQKLTLITESGLYKLIMRSDKPEARAFQDWVTQVVLPSIRKDGEPPHDRRGNNGASTPYKQGVLHCSSLIE